ncbi:hypothetical protein [Methylomonas sp. AM2-LC]|uniref:hypothetical protein n=1 Tax=Methylomonas sp. AM2-LC TaxID=3153301 RepID=UPI0032665A71
MTLITLFAKKEPTTDSVSIKHGLKHKMDTVFYRNAACTNVVARWSWDVSGCPRRGQKLVTLNCIKWSLSWKS